MNKTMMDILACPIDKNHPLELYEIKEENNIVSEGALFCPKCSRFYPIIEEIPIMLPDELRNKKQEIEFLTNNKKNLPEKIITMAKPWHL
ncbi:Trm112 family protein [Nitrosarchaeum sp.]|uniref:Trm112 family protein n=1 Tax=Nitrosarchaeum sp. TaxID=2026886 RepID=UPI00247BBDA2|nr:Trm112 family protein [Nitrosarchaeum sp.]MCV0412007.1 Trm112 family protein [Nitrosarchaeum sp.]